MLFELIARGVEGQECAVTVAVVNVVHHDGEET